MTRFKFLFATCLLLALIFTLAAGAGLSLAAPSPGIDAPSPVAIQLDSAGMVRQGIEEPTAVVLSSFSARIQGPPASLWALSATLLAAGFLLVIRHYPRKR